MSPKRRTKDHWLPQRVYRGKSAFEFRPRAGGAIRLCSLAASKAEVFQALARVLDQHRMTVQGMAAGYFESDRYTELKPRTQDDYQACWRKLEPVFGKTDPDTIEPKHVRKYMDLRSSRKRANLERVLLSNIFQWGVERGHCAKNPCREVQPFKLKGRDRYVTDAEYQAMYDQAPAVLQVFMELAYVCAARGQDIRTLRISDITDKGLMVAQQKTGKKQIKLWNTRLRAAVNRALELRREVVAKRRHDSVFLILNDKGRPYSESGLKTSWARHRLPGMDWTFHDLKAKAVSDFEGDKQQFSGHKSRLQMERYNRSADETTVIDWRK
jgi:integrase